MAEKNKELIRTIKFTLFSLSAGIIQAVSILLFEGVLHIPHWISYTLSYTLSVLWNFTFNRKFTFHSANNVPVAMAKVALYSVVFLAASAWWNKALTSPDNGTALDETVVTIVSMIINLVTEYLYQRFVVFGKSIDTAREKQN